MFVFRLPTSTSRVSYTIFESWRHEEASRLCTSTKIVAFVDKKLAVRVSTPSCLHFFSRLLLECGGDILHGGLEVCCGSHSDGLCRAELTNPDDHKQRNQTSCSCAHALSHRGL